MSLKKLFILREAKHLAELGRVIKANWQAMTAADKPMQVVLSEWKPKRSKQQNDRYWALLEQIADQVFVGGSLHHENVWHEYYKRKFIGVIKLPFGGEMGMSTTRLSVPEFNDYMMQIEADATQEHGVFFNGGRDG